MGVCVALTFSTRLHFLLLAEKVQGGAQRLVQSEPTKPA